MACLATRCVPRKFSRNLLRCSCRGCCAPPVRVALLLTIATLLLAVLLVALLLPIAALLLLLPVAAAVATLLSSGG